MFISGQNNFLLLNLLHYVQFNRQQYIKYYFISYVLHTVHERDNKLSSNLLHFKLQERADNRSDHNNRFCNRSLITFRPFNSHLKLQNEFECKTLYSVIFSYCVWSGNIPNCADGAYGQRAGISGHDCNMFRARVPRVLLGSSRERPSMRILLNRQHYTPVFCQVLIG
ncbi:Hypothetical_protein [Hexamita inflata]|uniref:Hypothetical_protein n=1 Tax=Hexamita inflata TaxID=28002 RepID=A0AA86TL48_9EUKA|nr:Hypothetical protein HINF_LOCUS8355 [Hexamita inflata]